MSTLLVQDLMESGVVSVRAHEDAATAYDLMASHRIRHLPVVAENNELVGLISQQDIMANVLFADNSLPVAERQDLLRAIRIEEIMTTSVETVSPTDTALEAGQTLLESKISCLPVVEGSQLRGIITEADFVSYVTDQLRTLDQAAVG